MALVDISALFTPAPLDPERLIPNQVYQTWKRPCVDETMARVMTAFRQVNAGFGFHFFDDARMQAYMDEVWGGHDIHGVFTATRHGAARADIWRYCILYERGGVYLDIDSTLKIKLDELPKGIAELISFETNPLLSQTDPALFPEDARYLAPPPALLHPGHLVLNWCLMFCPKHPVLERVIERICRHASRYRGVSFENVAQAIFHFSGPLVLTQAVWDHVEAGNRIKQAGFDFDGQGLFKIPRAATLYEAAPHYSTARHQAILG